MSVGNGTTSLTPASPYPQTLPPVKSSMLRTSSSTVSDLSVKYPVITEGWLELFLSPPEKFSFSKWNEVVMTNQSLVYALFAPIFQHLSQYLPETLAPNLVTLTGLVMLAQAWYLTNAYGDIAPISCTWLAVANILLFFVTSSITGYHADRIRQHTPLSDLFKYSCDNGATVFLAMLTVYCFGANVETQWYSVQACQLVLLLKHISAYERHAGLRYRMGAGPGEVLLMNMFLLICRATVGLERVLQVYYYMGGRFLHSLFEFGVPKAQRILEHPQTQKILEHPHTQKLFEKTAGNQNPSDVIGAALETEPELPTGEEVIKMAYFMLFTLAIVKAASLPKPHGWTRFGLIISLLMRLVPALLLEQSGVTVTDVICDGLFMAVLTSDLTLAKMSNRELHPWVVLMSVAAVLSYGVILTLVAVYFIGIFSDLCFYLNLPLLTTCRNVYCDGVYDLCHIGHKRAFQNALALGNRLFVGVVGDKDASNYKRPPIMTHAERCAEVEACKAVTKVIPNAPCFGLTQEFLDEHQIHVVAFGEEYLERYPNPDDDPYYSLPRKMGIARPLPRTNTLSTTDLITRIRNAQSVQKKSPT